jgi:hypothetical protein
MGENRSTLAADANFIRRESGKRNAVAETQEPILMQLLRQGIDIDSLENQGGEFYKGIFYLIRKSPSICEMAKQPWEYKSLAQHASEEFCQTPISYWSERDPIPQLPKQKISLVGAIKIFSEAVSRWIFPVEEGLRLFVKDSSGYRVATVADEDYKFLVKLNEEGHAFDLRFTAAPKWAQNLYLNSRALEVYGWFYDDYDGLDEQIRNARREAIARILDDEINVGVEKTAKPESTRKMENLLRVLACIAVDDYGYDPDLSKSTAPQDISNALSKLGQSIDPKTIRGWLKEGASLLQLKRD